MLICDLVVKFCILLNLRAFIYVLSCETLKMFGLLEVCFGNLPHMEVECDIIYVEYIVEIGKLMHNIDAC